MGIRDRAGNDHGVGGGQCLPDLGAGQPPQKHDARVGKMAQGGDISRVGGFVAGDGKPDRTRDALQRLQHDVHAFVGRQPAEIEQIHTGALRLTTRHGLRRGRHA